MGRFRLLVERHGLDHDCEAGLWKARLDVTETADSLRRRSRQALAILAADRGCERLGMATGTRVMFRPSLTGLAPLFAAYPGLTSGAILYRPFRGWGGELPSALPLYLHCVNTFSAPGLGRRTIIYADRKNNERRIISAWRSEPHKRRHYWQNLEAQ